ncbi:MAG: PAS domain S-box protein [Bacteroidetes bacterium]|nr:PAS domain S-box protein [Bacteroidota bacterium]
MADNPNQINILSLEDNPIDFEIIESELHKSLENIRIIHAETEQEYIAALSSEKIDVILSDFNLPGYTAIEALELSKQECPEVPFICLSGAIGEGVAIDMLKSGAVDYLFKDKMDKLPYAIRRALDEAKEKKNLREAEKALKESNELLSLFMKVSPIYAYIKEVSEAASRVILASENYIDMIGIPGSEMVGKTMEELFLPDLAAQITADDQKVVSEGIILTVEEELDGRFYTSIKFPITRNGKTMLAGYTIDITERKTAAAALVASEANMRAVFNATDESIFLLDSDKRVISLNPVAANRMGRNADEIIGRTLSELLKPEIFANRLPYIEKALSGCRQVSFEDESNGHWMINSLYPVCNENGKAERIAIFSRDICDRKKAESARLIYQANLEALLENTGDRIWAVDKDFNVIISNNLVLKKVQEHTGANFEIGKSALISKLPADKRARWHSYYARGLSGESFSIEEDIQYTGKTGYRDFHFNPIRTENGRITGVVVSGRDITERKLSEKLLQESESRYRSVLESAADAIIMINDSGTIIGWNESASMIFGYTEEETIGNPVTSIMPASFRQSHPHNLKRLKDGGVPVLIGKTIELSGIRKDGSEFPLELSLSSYETSTGKYYTGIIRDITDRIEAVDALKQSEEKFRSIFENHSAVKLIIDPSTSLITDANESAAHFYGWSINELKNLSIRDLSTSNEKDVFESFKLIRDKKEGHFEFQHKCRDGSVKDVEIFTSWLSISGRDYLHSIIHDITDKKKAEEQISLLSKSIEQSPVCVVITDPKGTIEYVNSSFTRITGYSQQEAIGKNPRILKSFFHSEEFYRQLWDTLSAGQQWNGEFKNRKKNGELFWEKASISPLVNEKGETTHYVGIKEDITEKKKLTEELILAKEKAEAGDRLKTAFINNISHEIRTPLNGILGFSEMLLSNDITQEKKQIFNDIVKKSGIRLLETITSYMDISMIVSGNVSPNLKLFNLKIVLDEIKSDFSYSCKEKQLEFSISGFESPEEIQLRSDPELLKKILSNLVRNAVKFTQKGSIEIGFRITEYKPVIFVRDSGTGIEKEMIRSIFDNFVQADMSMTRAYEGSGLGLSIAFGLARLLGGELAVNSEKGKGSEFYFSLPPEVLVIAGKKKTITTSLRPKESGQLILVAEDDDFNYKFLEIVLLEAGYKIIHAKNGAEALTMCRKEPKVALVLMDLKMPVLGGIAATRMLRETHPDLPVIALTAHVSPKEENDAMESGCNAFLPKPINVSKLLGMMSMLLDK